MCQNTVYGLELDRATHSTRMICPSSAYGMSLFLTLIVSSAWLRLDVALRSVAEVRLGGHDPQVNTRPPTQEGRGNDAPMRKRRRDQLLQLLRVRDRACDEAWADVAVLHHPPPTTRHRSAHSPHTPSPLPHALSSHSLLSSPHTLSHTLPPHTFFPSHSLPSTPPPLSLPPLC